MINWNRLFPPLRHRQNANYQDHRPSDQDTPPPTEVSEEQVIFYIYYFIKKWSGIISDYVLSVDTISESFSTAAQTRI